MVQAAIIYGVLSVVLNTLTKSSQGRKGSFQLTVCREVRAEIEAESMEGCC